VPTSAVPAGPAGPVPGTECTVFPADNIWNTSIKGLPVHKKSKAWMATMKASTTKLHPDFGAPPYGMPFAVVDDSHPTVFIDFEYADESDPGPYPFGADTPLEQGSDAHALMINGNTCTLFELFAADWNNGDPQAGSGAVFGLGSNALRPAGWTSADAAGLPILPGLARYDEVRKGSIDHALRFTAPCTSARYVYPARHEASTCHGFYPPMGLRVRLKAHVNIAGLPRQARIVAQALKRYGMILADNGSPWFISGAPNRGWNNDALHLLDRLHGADFEVVATTSLPHPGQQ
jgi:hypothetical protein